MVRISQTELIFGEIRKCLNFNDSYFFEIYPYITESFSEHFQAFEIKLNENETLQYFNCNSFNFFPTNKHVINEKLFLRYRL